MINILVCLKMVPDMDMVISSDWDISSGRKSIDISYANRILNYFDEISLELALRLKDYGPDVKITTLSIGPQKCESILRDSLAAGADKAVRVDCGKDFKIRSYAVSTIIKNALRSLGSYDIVFLGKQAGEFDNAQTGLLVAGMLGYPCISQVENIEQGKDYLKVTHQVLAGHEILSIKPPVVLITGDTSGVGLRMASLRERIEANKKKVDIVPIKDLDLDEKTLDKYDNKDLIEIFSIKSKIECRYIKGDSIDEKTERLLEELKEYL